VIDLENLLSFLNKIEKLKCITRHSWTSDGRKESVAEHSWRLAILVYLLRSEFKGCNFEK
jgi:putative hydrolase of HD superfamily